MSTAQEKLMGRTTETVTVENYIDVYRTEHGEIPPEEVRRAEVDAIVDTGATYLCLPPEIIGQLGLAPTHSRDVKTANGTVQRRVFGGARVTIKGRTEQLPVMENDETTPPLIGYIVLEVLDFVVDPKSQRLIGNPEHEGKWMADLY